MKREKGSDASRVEIFGGPHDGAVGTVVEIAVENGKRLTTVRLDDGTVITVASVIDMDPELPREQGT